MILYKYMPCNEFTFKALAVRGLWCHNPREMNDPSECLDILERTLPVPEIVKLHELIKSTPNSPLAMLANLPNNQVNKILSESRKRMANSFAFCSLSTKCDDVLMWSHYANCHKGMVIGIEPDTDEAQDSLQKVEYLNHLPDWNVEEYFRFMNGEDEFRHIFLRDLSVKSKHWHQESEYRIWRKQPGYWLYKEEQIKEVYFGVDCDLITKKVVLELLNFLPENFPIYEMEINKETLDLTW